MSNFLHLFVCTVYANLGYNQLSRRLKATLEGYSKKNKRFYSHDLWNLPDLAGFAVLGKILYGGGKICSAMM